LPRPFCSRFAARPSGDGVEEDDHVLAHLDQPPGSLENQSRDSKVIRARSIGGRGDDLALHRAPHMGHFLGTLVDEQNEEMDLRIELADGEANLLEEDGFSRLRRGDDEASLTSADWGHQIDDAEEMDLDLRKPQPLEGCSLTSSW
jgi:hypothetical protein